MIQLDFFRLLIPPCGRSSESFCVVEPIDTGWVFGLARAPRLRRLMHQPFASSILTITELQRVGCRAQPSRQSGCESCCHGATMALERELRPVETRRKDVLFNCCFKSIVMCSYNP